MNTLYIVVPAYNESENIEALIEDWYPVVERYNEKGDSRLVIINDGSKDNTYEMLCKAAETRPLKWTWFYRTLRIQVCYRTRRRLYLSD